MSEFKTEEPQKSLEQLPQGSKLRITLNSEEVRRVWPKAEDQGNRTFTGIISGREVVLKINDDYDKQLRISFDIRGNELYYGETTIGKVEVEQE